MILLPFYNALSKRSIFLVELSGEFRIGVLEAHEEDQIDGQSDKYEKSAKKLPYWTLLPIGSDRF